MQRESFWTLFAASTSDSAATQKRFNKLINDCREKDEHRFGAATLETIEDCGIILLYAPWD